MPLMCSWLRASPTEGATRNSGSRGETDPRESAGEGNQERKALPPPSGTFREDVRAEATVPGTKERP